MDEIGIEAKVLAYRGYANLSIADEDRYRQSIERGDTVFFLNCRCESLDQRPFIASQTPPSAEQEA